MDPSNPQCQPNGTHVFVHGLDRVVPEGTRKVPSIPKLTDRCQCGKYTWDQLKSGIPLAG
jgi:hypothetical protein